MDLFVVRHAVAEERGPHIRDEERALTEKGRERFTKMVACLNRLDVHFDRVLCSPWLRAVQTAEMLDALGGPRLESPHLAGEPGEDLLQALDGSRVAVVGHEPWLGDLVTWLITGDVAGLPVVELKKGAVVWLCGEPDPGGMKLRSYLTTSAARKLA